MNRFLPFLAPTGGCRDSWRNALYRGDYMFIEYPEYASAELHNLARDPAETRDLAAEEPARLAQMKSELASILAGMNVPDPEPNPDFVPGNATTNQR